MMGVAFVAVPVLLVVAGGVIGARSTPRPRRCRQAPG